ncbi:MAG: coproporphyrinogen III oxidase family protein, partial [Pirellula sp.]
SGGTEHYEISNFARAGEACRHNQAYWNSNRWWGFGPSAASYLGDMRCVNHRGTLQYLSRIESGLSAVEEFDRLSLDQQCRERFVFGMRQIQGVDWDQLQLQFPATTSQSIQASLTRHIEQGWIERAGRYVRLTRSGLVLSDGLWNEYLRSSP